MRGTFFFDYIRTGGSAQLRSLISGGFLLADRFERFRGSGRLCCGSSAKIRALFLRRIGLLGGSRGAGCFLWRKICVLYWLLRFRLFPPALFYSVDSFLCDVLNRLPSIIVCTRNGAFCAAFPRFDNRICCGLFRGCLRLPFRTVCLYYR